MKMHDLFRVGLMLMCVACAVHAQKASTRKVAASEHKLVSVKVTGTERYTEKEIVPASGLQMGKDADDPDFKEAVRRLGDTGLFTEISYSFSYSPAGTKVELQLKDADAAKLLPAHFENFVWFTDAELTGELERRVPLFKGVLPTSGTISDEISEALQTMLNEKKIPGHVNYLRDAPQEGGPLTAIAYSVEDLAIVVQKIEFPGAGPDQLAPLQTAARKLMGAHYFRSSLALVAKDDFLPVYLQRGYLKAAFAPSEGRVISQDEGDVQVAALFPVTPGKVYSVSDVVWSGNSALPTNQLQPLIHLPAGQPADAVRLDHDLEGVDRLYHSHGYMTARIKPDFQLDEEKSTVHYNLRVTEGDQYKMGEVEITGLDPQFIAKLQEAWSLHEGDPYNADYPNKFLDGSTRLLPGGVHWGVSVHETMNEKDKTVDVTIRFSPR